MFDFFNRRYPLNSCVSTVAGANCEDHEKQRRYLQASFLLENRPNVHIDKERLQSARQKRVLTVIFWSSPALPSITQP